MLKQLVIDFAPIVISIFSLGWNFYRDVVLRARSKAHISICSIYHHEEMLGPFIAISVVNLGPQKLHFESIYIGRLSVCRYFGPLVARLFRCESKYAHVMWDYTNDYSSRLPVSLDVGEKATLLIRFEEGAFLSVDPTHVGITDSMGRFHWVSAKSLRIAKSQYFDKFPKKAWG